MTCSFGNDEVKTTAGLKAGNTEMFLSMTPLASWPEDSPGNKTLRKRCYPTFFAVMLLASIWHPAGFCGESDSQSLSDCLRSPCPAVSDFYARQQVNLHSISMRDFLYQKYHKTFTLISYILSTFDRSLICFDSACQFYGASISDIIRLVPRSEISARLSSLLQIIANWREDRCRWWSSFQGHHHPHYYCHRPAIIANILAISKLHAWPRYWSFVAKKRCFCFLIVETATLKGFYRKHLAMLSNIQCCHFQSPHPRDSHQKDWDGKISW